MHLTAVITACLRVHEMRYNPDADSQTHALFNDNILRIICVENNVLSDEGLFRAFDVYPPPPPPPPPPPSSFLSLPLLLFPTKIRKK